VVETCRVLRRGTTRITSEDVLNVLSYLCERGSRSVDTRMLGSMRDRQLGPCPGFSLPLLSPNTFSERAEVEHQKKSTT
jgi:hypothetical protein